ESGGGRGGGGATRAGERGGVTPAGAATYEPRTLDPGYAIPADEHFRRALEVLRRGEEIEYGFLGVTLAQPPVSGIVIGQVTRFGPADQAGIAPNDPILKINGQPPPCHEDPPPPLGFP